jgi:hypothetical protein
MKSWLINFLFNGDINKKNLNKTSYIWLWLSYFIQYHRLHNFCSVYILTSITCIFQISVSMTFRTVPEQLPSSLSPCVIALEFIFKGSFQSRTEKVGIFFYRFVSNTPYVTLCNTSSDDYLNRYYQIIYLGCSVSNKHSLE